MPTKASTSRSKIVSLAGVVVLVAAVVAGGLWLARDGDSEDAGIGADPNRNTVSDDRVPTMTVTIRSDAGQLVADIAYDALGGRVPWRETTAFLQTMDDSTWSTTHSLASHALNEDGDNVVESVVDMIEDDAAAGPGPDTYPLPDLGSNTTYRICLGFIVGRPATDATGCSTPFQSN